MTSSSRPVRRRRKATKSLVALSDDLLQEIFLLVGSPADLVRASTACVAFRRLIADPTFLRRYRSLQPPLLLGTLYLGSVPCRFGAVDAPNPNAPLGGALASAADFSFSYLPLRKWHTWRPCDVRDGRVLLARGPSSCGTVLRELAVCDPLTREYLLLPDIPDGLLASIQVWQPDLLDFEAFFIPSGDREETTFQVICRAHSVTKSLVLVFSSGSGTWRIGTCTGWDSLSLKVTRPRFGRVDDRLLSSPQWAHHCCYWKLCQQNKLLKLDTRRMEFSTVDLPPDDDNRQCVIVEVEEGKIAMFTLISYGTSVDYYTFLRDDGGKDNNAWHLKKSIPLSTRYLWRMKNAAAEGLIFLEGTLRNCDSAYSEVFSLHIKTFTMERIGKIKNKYPYGNISPYFGFPPSMSPRRIQGQSAGSDSHPAGRRTPPVPWCGTLVRGNEDMKPFVYFSGSAARSLRLS